MEENESNLRKLIEQNNDAFYILDKNGNITDVNKRMSQLTGYSKEELLRLNLKDILDPSTSYLDQITQNLNDLLKPDVKKCWLLGKDGSILEVKINAKIVADDKVMVIAHDLTEIKQIEIQLNDAQLKFSTLAEESMTGVYIIQQEKLTYVNPRFAAIFGYRASELIQIGNHFIDQIISEKYREIVRENIRARLSGRVNYISYEIEGLKKDGSNNYLEVSGNMAIINGEPTIVGTMSDVTRRWQLEDRLQQTDASLQAILETTDTAYIILNPKLEIIALNQVAVEFVQRQYNHTLEAGDQLKDHFSPGKGSELFELIKQVLAGNKTNYEMDYINPQGQVYWYHIKLCPIIDRGEHVTGVLMALADVTGRKNTEQDLQIAYSKIHSHIKSITDMVWKQSHLIRSPLANLKALVRLLRNEPGDALILDYLQTELERLDNIILDMSAEADSIDE